MKTILVDLNIILDYLEDREGCENAGKIFSKCFLRKLKGYVCAHEITTLSYFLGKIRNSRTENIKIISGIMRVFEIIEINKAVLESALLSNITDFEDAVIVESAKMKKVDFILTHNIKDFKNSPVPAMLPEECLARK